MSTDNPDDWRYFRSLRNQVTARLRDDKKSWELKKLDISENNPTEIWRAVKGWLSWGSSGTPIQLFWQEKMITSPSGLANVMNYFFLEKVENLRGRLPLATGDPLNKLRKAQRNKKLHIFFHAYK